MNEFTVVNQDPAQSLGQGVKDFWAAFTPESQANGKVISTLPGNAKEMPIVRVNGDDFEHTGDLCLGQPSALTCETDQRNGMVNCGVLHGKVWTGMRLLMLGMVEP